MNSIPFTKLHGLGNDFVLIDKINNPQVALTKQIILSFADRKRGVGFDQLLLMERSNRVDAKMTIYNTDGSIAEMCGNGLRAAALYLWQNIQGLSESLTIETDAGDRRVRLLSPVAEGFIETEMGEPKFLKTPKLLASGIQLKGQASKTPSKTKPHLVNVGNPHAVLFVTPPQNSKQVQWLTENGSKIETHKAFPKRTNVEFVKVINPHKIQVWVWERGVGLTEACGTGAVASATAAIKEGKVKSPVEVRFPGGTVEVSWNGPGYSAFLRGHASASFNGVFYIEE